MIPTPLSPAQIRDFLTDRPRGFKRLFGKMRKLRANMIGLSRRHPSGVPWDGQWDLGDGVARTHVILDDSVLKAIDDKVGQRGRSRFLEEAAREKLERIDLEDAIRKGAGLLKDEDYPYWRDTESVQEWVRASRRGELTADDVPAR